MLFKTDGIIDGVHFDSARANPGEIGHKAVARPLSDIAAMGCTPSYGVVGMMIPKRARASFIRGVLRGMERTAKKFNMPIVGGDVASHPGRLAITVSLLGEARGVRPVLRSGARPGDLLAVTGALGGSILGKHLRFTPRVREGLALNRRFNLHAMIDISDGLATDLGHLCDESGVGAVIEEDLLPISPAARRLARRDGRSPLDHALTDGEDYELLFAVPKKEGPRLSRSGKGILIGEMISKRGTYLKDPGGDLRKLLPEGWDHGFGRRC